MPVEVVDLVITRCRLKSIRTALGLTQEQVAYIAGLGTAKEISKIENMHRGHVPKMITLLRIATALGVRIDELYVVSVKTRPVRKTLEK